MYRLGIYTMKNIFAPHLASVSALHAKYQNKEITSFHTNAVRFFAKRTQSANTFKLSPIHRSTNKHLQNEGCMHQTARRISIIVSIAVSEWV